MSASSPQPLTNLHPEQRRRRTQVWRRHVQARLAGGQPNEAVAEAVRSDLERAGIESETVGATMALVDALRGDEERRPLLSEDQAWRAGRPPAGSPYRTRPLEPVAIERIRAELGRRGATLVSVIAYAGLAPDEAFTLRWSEVGADALSVETGWARRSGHGQADRRRSVRLLPPVADDLAAWRLVTSHPDDHDPVFPPSRARRADRRGLAALATPPAGRPRSSAPACRAGCASPTCGTPSRCCCSRRVSRSRTSRARAAMARWPSSRCTAAWSTRPTRAARGRRRMRLPRLEAAPGGAPR